MPSFTNIAVLATAFSSVLAAPITDVTDLLSEFFVPGVLQGHNYHAQSGNPISLGSNGPFQVEFQNSHSADIDLVLWSSYGQEGSWGVMTVNVANPNITITIPANETRSVSFNPEAYTEENGFPNAQQSISGAFAPLYPGTTTAEFGGIDNTWGEFTFSSQTVFSTLDVSRLANMTGTPMQIETFASKGAEQACMSDMNTCVYVCAEGEQSCNGAEASNCAGNTGCMGMSPSGGYTLVTFL